MKKISVIFFAAIAMLTVASCAKEELAPNEPGIFNGKTNFITVAVSLSEDTKTGLSPDGKTVTWASGDSLLVTDGSKKCAIYIPEEYDGQKTATIKIDGSKVDSTKQLYAVYPYAAFSKIDGGKIVVNVPTEQSGEFAAANISVAKMDTTYKFAMKNVASIFKVTIADDISTLMISGGKADTLAAALTVDYTDADTPVSITKTSPVKSVRLAVGGIGGDYYVAVVPGTYSTELSMLAVTADGQSEKVSATKAHTLAINDIADLGRIGDNPAGAKFDGDGTEESPYLIKTSADMTVLANAVNHGVDYAGSFFKVSDNISGVETPVGTYDGADFYFKGTFDGDGKTITLAMGGSDCQDSNLGLFGNVGEGACIKNVNIGGSITTSGSSVGGVAGCVNAGEGATIENCTSAAVIKGGSEVGGIVGYADATVQPMMVIKNCSNSMTVQGTYNVGGIIGYAVRTEINNCPNKGEVVGTYGCGGVYSLFKNAYRTRGIDGNSTGDGDQTVRGIGGIAGVLQNSNVVSSDNYASVSGVTKAGGIAGTIYWGSVQQSNNSGSVSVSNQIVGGIAGMTYCQGTVKNCVNSASLTSPIAVGGIMGAADGQERSSGSCYITIQDCSNTGVISATSKVAAMTNDLTVSDVSVAAGIVAYVNYMNRSWPVLYNCVNNADISAAGKAVGGIVGYVNNTRNGSDWGSFYGCVNNGKITSETSCAGGVVGFIFDRYNTCRLALRNCQNNAEVEAPTHVGGICGFAWDIYGGNGKNGLNYPINFENCYNKGAVTYTNSESAAPNVGGILGYGRHTRVANCCNEGVLSCKTTVADTTAKKAAAYIGLVQGAGDGCNTLSNSYANGSDTDNLLGTHACNNKRLIENNSAYDSENGYTLYNEVKVGTSYQGDSFIEAANAWANAYSTASLKYYTWQIGAEGPEFVK